MIRRHFVKVLGAASLTLYPLLNSKARDLQFELAQLELHGWRWWISNMPNGSYYIYAEPDMAGMDFDQWYATMPTLHITGYSRDHALSNMLMSIRAGQCPCEMCVLQRTFTPLVGYPTARHAAYICVKCHDISTLDTKEDRHVQDELNLLRFGVKSNGIDTTIITAYMQSQVASGKADAEVAMFNVAYISGRTPFSRCTLNHNTEVFDV